MSQNCFKVLLRIFFFFFFFLKDLKLLGQTDKQHQGIPVGSCHTSYRYVLSPLQPFTENERGMPGRLPEPPQGCSRADAGSSGCLWDPEGGSWGLVDVALVTGRAGRLWRSAAGLAGEAASGTLVAAV